MKKRIFRIVTGRCGDPRIGTQWAFAVGMLAVLIVVGVAVAQPRPAGPLESEGVAQPGPREQERLDPALAGRRNVLSRLRDQLQQQVRDTEAALRECPDPMGGQGQVLRSELETLREQIRIVGEQLGDLGMGPNRGRPVPMGIRRELPMSPELDRRAAELKEHHQALSEKARLTQRRLEGLGGDRGPEVRELEDQLRLIHEQIGDTERQMAELQRARAEAQRVRPMDSPDRARPEGPWPRVAGEAQNRAERLQDLLERERQARGRLDELGDRNSEEAKALQRELDRTREEIAATERSLRSNEADSRIRQLERPTVELRGGSEMVTRVYKLRHAGAEQMLNIVRPLLGRSGQVSADPRTGALVVTDTQDSHGRIAGVIRELDAQEGSGPRTGTEVEELRTQVNGLQDQMRQMRALLEQLVPDKGAEQADAGRAAPK